MTMQSGGHFGYMTEDQCRRLHEEMDSRYQQFVEESRKDRESIHEEIKTMVENARDDNIKVDEKIGSLQKWAIGLILTVFLGSLALIIQGAYRGESLGQVKNEVVVVHKTVSDMNSTVGALSWRVGQVQESLDQHKADTRRGSILEVPSGHKK